MHFEAVTCRRKERNGFLFLTKTSYINVVLELQFQLNKKLLNPTTSKDLDLMHGFRKLARTLGRSFRRSRRPCLSVWWKSHDPFWRLSEHANASKSGA